MTYLPLWSKTKTLTENTDTGFVEIALATGERVSGEIIYEVYATDTVDHQVCNGTLRYNATNKAGTILPSVVEVGEQNFSVPVGQTFTVTNSVLAGTNKITLQCKAVSSLTQTILEIRYRVNTVSTNVVTPLV